MNNKQYLDFPGLSYYTELLKALIKANDNEVLLDSKNYTDNLIGDLNLIKNNITTVAAGILAERDRAQTAEASLSANLDWGKLGE